MTTVSCGDVNSAWTGSIQVQCKYGQLAGDYSDCKAIPCPAGYTEEVVVGWSTLWYNSNANVAAPREMAHWETWTADCSLINEEFVGDVEMTCYGGTFRSNAAGCVQQEVGCRPTGQGLNVTFTFLGNYSYALRPLQAVAAGETFALDCSDFTDNEFVGTGVTATCHDMGGVSADTSMCSPASCVKGQTVNISHGNLIVVGTLSESLVHNGVEEQQCQDVDEALRGTVPMACRLGKIVPDMSGCEIFCLPSRPSQVLLGGVINDVAPPEILADGLGLWTDCGYVMSGSDTLKSTLPCAVRCHAHATLRLPSLSTTSPRS